MKYCPTPSSMVGDLMNSEGLVMLYEVLPHTLKYGGGPDAHGQAVATDGGYQIKLHDFATFLFDDLLQGSNQGSIHVFQLEEGVHDGQHVLLSHCMDVKNKPA